MNSVLMVLGLALIALFALKFILDFLKEGKSKDEKVG